MWWMCHITSFILVHLFIYLSITVFLKHILSVSNRTIKGFYCWFALRLVCRVLFPAIQKGEIIWHFSYAFIVPYWIPETDLWQYIMYHWNVSDLTDESQIPCRRIQYNTQQTQTCQFTANTSSCNGATFINICVHNHNNHTMALINCNGFRSRKRRKYMKMHSLGEFELNTNPWIITM